MQGLSNFFDELGKWRRSEGKDKGQKSHSPHPFSLPIEGRLVIQWGWVSEAEEDDEDEQEKPSRIVKDGDEGHDCDGDEKDSSAPSPKEGIGNVASV